MIEEKRLTVQIKGIRDGLLITLGEGEWPELLAALLAHIDEKGSFFQGARVALDVGNHILRAAEMGSLRDKLSDKGVMLWAVLSNSAATEKNAQALGMATKLPSARSEAAARMLDAALGGEDAMLVHRTLRSGNRISFQGHVVVIGDVNPGAEIIAGRSIVIWGKLRGVVHAGAEGNEEAVVCALDMMPTQLRIAGLIAVTPQRKGKPQPEIARVKEGQVVADPWNYREGAK